jgi:hypothetical protein
MVCGIWTLGQGTRGGSTRWLCPAKHAAILFRGMSCLHLLYTGYYCDTSYRDSHGALATCIIQDSMFDSEIYAGVPFFRRNGLILMISKSEECDIQGEQSACEPSHLDTVWATCLSFENWRSHLFWDTSSRFCGLSFRSVPGFSTLLLICIITSTKLHRFHMAFGPRPAHSVAKGANEDKLPNQNVYALYTSEILVLLLR